MALLPKGGGAHKERYRRKGHEKKTTYPRKSRKSFLEVRGKPSKRQFLQNERRKKKWGVEKLDKDKHDHRKKGAKKNRTF